MNPTTDSVTGITERESWILGNLEKDPNLGVQANRA